MLQRLTMIWVLYIVSWETYIRRKTFTSEHPYIVLDLFIITGNDRYLNLDNVLKIWTLVLKC